MTSQATMLAQVYASLRSEELGRLLREAGYDVELLENQDRPTYRTLSEPQFNIRLLGALEDKPKDYHSICVWSRIAVSPAVLADVMHRARSRNMFALLLADRAGQLLVTHDILIGGGVTAHHLKHQFSFWRSDLARVHRVIRESQGEFDGRRLN